MNNITKNLANITLTMFLVTIIIGPVTAVGLMGGIKNQLERGEFLGAKITNQGLGFSELKNGEIKKLKLTTFWGQEATYKNILKIKNKTTTTQKYQLEILEVKGQAPKKQTIIAIFQNGSSTINLNPGETTPITVTVKATPLINQKTSNTEIKLAIWQN